MKRLIAAGILLIFVLASYFTAKTYITALCDETNVLLKECIIAYDNGDDAEKAAKKLNDFWNEHEQPLSVFANHERIDEIELAISSMLIYSSTTEKEIFHEYSGTVETLLHQLIEDTKPSAHSIL